MSRSFSHIPWAVGVTRAFLWFGCFPARAQCLSSQLMQWENSLNIERAGLSGVQWAASQALGYQVVFHIIQAQLKGTLRCISIISEVLTGLRIRIEVS